MIQMIKEIQFTKSPFIFDSMEIPLSDINGYALVNYGEITREVIIFPEITKYDISKEVSSLNRWGPEKGSPRVKNGCHFYKLRGEDDEPYCMLLTRGSYDFERLTKYATFGRPDTPSQAEVLLHADPPTKYAKDMRIVKFMTISELEEDIKKLSHNMCVNSSTYCHDLFVKTLLTYILVTKQREKLDPTNIINAAILSTVVLENILGKPVKIIGEEGFMKIGDMITYCDLLIKGKSPKDSIIEIFNKYYSESEANIIKNNSYFED